MIGAYAAVGIAVVCVVGAVRDWRIPGHTDHSGQAQEHHIDVQPTARPPHSPATCTLPADTAAFTGRRAELDTIASAVTSTAHAGQVVAIHAIDGMPGVGKTTLAIHAGHLLASKFPDRQLFIDLHGHTPGRKPDAPADVLATLLTADGVDVQFLSPGLDGRAAMWRARMAGRRVLLILDNASGTDQIRPLLPGAADCMVLVTSRRYLVRQPHFTS